MQHKYFEQLIRHAALTAEGKSCEILERVTFERRVDADGSPAEPAVVNRRYDLRTGERVNPLGNGEFEDDVTGEKLRLRV
jgi:hypothetical protein